VTDFCTADIHIEAIGVVIPAQSGIQRLAGNAPKALDPRVRGDDAFTRIAGRISRLP
jgi:hypothetical protein